MAGGWGLRAMGGEKRQHDTQNALFKDFAAYTNVYPELKEALDIIIKKLVNHRPADPLAYMANELREMNKDFKLEKAMKDAAAVKIQQRARGINGRSRVTGLKTKQKEDAAAAKIQSIGRKNRDKGRVEDIKRLNFVWLRETYRKLDRESKDAVLHSDIIILVSGDKEGIAKLELPARLTRMVPPKFSGQYKSIRTQLQSQNTPDKEITWIEFAGMFGLSESQAETAEKEAAAVRIQAIGRGKRDKGRVKGLAKVRGRMDSVDEGEELLGYTVDHHGIDNAAHGSGKSARTSPEPSSAPNPPTPAETPAAEASTAEPPKPDTPAPDTPAAAAENVDSAAEAAAASEPAAEEVVPEAGAESKQDAEPPAEVAKEEGTAETEQTAPAEEAPTPAEDVASTLTQPEP